MVIDPVSLMLNLNEYLPVTWWNEAQTFVKSQILWNVKILDNIFLPVANLWGVWKQLRTSEAIYNWDAQAKVSMQKVKVHSTYVAPTDFNLRNSSVNRYRTNLPLSGSSISKFSSRISSSGLAISNKTVPDSISRILKRVKSICNGLRRPSIRYSM